MVLSYHHCDSFGEVLMPLLSAKYVKQELDGFPRTIILPVVESLCLKGRVEMSWKFEKRMDFLHQDWEVRSKSTWLAQDVCV